MKKKKILAMPLVDFGIKPLTNWVKREERKLRRNIEYWTKRCENPTPSDDPKDKPEERLEECKRKIASQPITVWGLVHTYPYRFRCRLMRNGRLDCIGLGDETIQELKKKLMDIGLTPDDWPALVHHNELLKYLSKEVILGLPIQEVFVTTSGWSYHLSGFMGCSEEELKTKTVKDFISVNPMEVTDVALQFFLRRRQQFVAIHQKLVAKGFTTRDGAFFKWNPKRQSLAKAMQRLDKYNLTNSEYHKFAKIVVAERWVV